jgi:hypothetical protein
MSILTQTPSEVTPSPKNILHPQAIYSRQDLAWLCSWMTLSRWEKAGKLHRIGHGKIVRYKGSDVLTCLEGKAKK